MKDDNNNDSLPEDVTDTDVTKPDDKSLVDNNPAAKNLAAKDLDIKNSDTAISEDLDPAKEEAGWLRHWYRQGLVSKIVIV